MTYCDTMLDLMFERACEQMWEEQNKTVYDEETVEKAGCPLRHALEEYEMAFENANEVAEALADTPLGDRLVSIVNDMESLLVGLKAIKKELGVRE